MGGEKVSDPDQMVIVLDHNARLLMPKLATQYQDIRNIVAGQGISKFLRLRDGLSAIR
jgi:homoaconitase/3-isopropylmalate dehydratase large subunit